MVQRFPELYRVHQGMAVDVCLVMAVQFLTAKMERGNLSAVGFKPDLSCRSLWAKPDTAQVTAHA